MANDHNIRIIQFETRYKRDANDQFVRNADGEVIGVDYVEFSAVGNAKHQVTPMRIIDAQRDLTGLWDVIGPSYEAWKKGEVLPEGGTPLAVWNGCTPEMAKALRAFDVKTVEDIADLTEAMVQKIGLGGLYPVRTAAKRYVEAKDTRDIAVALTQKDEQIAAMQQQMDEMMALVRAQSGDVEKRRPGRPRKEDAEMSA